MKIDYSPILLEEINSMLDKLDNSNIQNDIELLKEEINEILNEWEV